MVFYLCVLCAAFMRNKLMMMMMMMIKNVNQNFVQCLDHMGMEALACALKFSLRLRLNSLNSQAITSVQSITNIKTLVV